MPLWTYFFLFSEATAGLAWVKSDYRKDLEDLRLSRAHVDEAPGHRPWHCGKWDGSLVMKNTVLGGGFKYLLFSSLFREDEPILANVFQRGWNHQPVFLVLGW